MWKKPGSPVVIAPSQVVIGLYIWLDIPWDDHPFLYNRFKVTSEKQVCTVRALPIRGKLYYYPDKSSASPLPLSMANEASVVQPDDGSAAALALEMARENKEKHERLWKLKDAAARADRAWEQAARVTREAMLGMGRTPKQAGQQLADLSRNTAKLISESQEVLLHLLGDKNGEGPQFHALNTMTLAMLLGKVAGLGEAQLSELALGALSHDIGKLRIPLHILKAKKRAKHEEDFYRAHPAYGTEIAKSSEAFGSTALAIIADHHELIDGSGWPKGKNNAAPAARIVALVNRYDRLCSPESPDNEALMPSEALSRLFRFESGKYDQQLLSLMIKLLGVYPPGTVVRLNDESLGLVVSPGRESLRPTVLIYTPEIAKQEAPTVDLSQNTELKIEEAIRPSTLPPDVLGWMNPRQRLSYFFSTEKK